MESTENNESKVASSESGARILIKIVLLVAVPAAVFATIKVALGF